MRVRYLSDLHLEREHSYTIKKIADSLMPTSDDEILVLAGDICDGSYIKYVLEILCCNWKQVVYLPGNHEHYGRSLQEAWSEFPNQMPDNVHLLRAKHPLKVGEYTFIGDTMWTGFHSNPIAEQAIPKFINDFIYIIDASNPQNNLSTSRIKEMFHEAVCYMAKALDEHREEHGNCDTAVVVSHFAPIVTKENSWGPGGPYFSHDLSRMIFDYQPGLWVYGHTHEVVRTEIGKTLVVTNAARGFDNGRHPDFSLDTFERI